MITVNRLLRRFEAEADITLTGVREDGRDVPNFGQKFIGVDEGGHLQIHGAKKLSWTRYSVAFNTYSVTTCTLSAIRTFPRFCKLFSESSTVVMQLPCCPVKQGEPGELSENC